MDGMHVIELVYDNGRTERVPCECDWCDAWRAMQPKFDRILSSYEPEVRPDWLGKKPTAQ